MLNLVVIVGRLVRDCTVYKTNEGQSVCNFSIATNANGDTKAEFLDCTAWRQNADFLGNYGKKGNLYLIVGKIHKNARTMKDGTKRYEQVIECKTVESLTRKSEYSSVVNAVANNVLDGGYDGDELYGDEPY